MSNEDIIELGSSEEESEPSLKKIKLTNAMVVIPSQHRSLNSVRSNSTIIQKAINPANTVPLLTKPIIFRNTNSKSNSNILNQKCNVTTSQAAVLKKLPKEKINSKNLFMNPLCGYKNLIKKSIVKRLPSIKKQRGSTVQPGLNLLNNLPPDIIIKPVSKAGISGTKSKCNTIDMKKKSTILVESEIDVDKPLGYPSKSPQWYIRPEEISHNLPSTCVETNVCKAEGKTDFEIEEENNREPDAAKYVEIVIEDSPVKHHNDIGKELSITIEDSPVKPCVGNNKAKESDSESEVCTNKVPVSKKKLEYLIQKKMVESNMCTSPICNNNLKDEPNCENVKEEQVSEIINIIESSQNDNESSTLNNTADADHKKTNCEFHPEYKKFIDLCFQLENSLDMNKIVEKKIKAYYKQCPKEYVESEGFIEMVSSKIISMKAVPDKMYLYIKDIVEELNLQRKMFRNTVPKKEVAKDANKLKEDVDEGESFDYKRHRQIRKLEKTIKKLHRAVTKLEEQEVDLEDDEENSVYFLTERYKERLVRVYEKLCQVTNTKMPSEPRIHIEARPGQPSGPAKRIEMWINKKVPVGSPLPFPDFHDVVCCVREANKEDRLGWSEAEVMEEARDLFTRCGIKLQRRRQENEWRIASSRVSHHSDPAESNEDLKKKLEENKKIAASKESDIFNKFVEKQKQMNLKATEIDDKDADQSPAESDDDDDAVEENNSLESQKRKHTLKRLIQEKIKTNNKNSSSNFESIQTKNDTNLTNSQINTSMEFSSKEINNVDVHESQEAKEHFRLRTMKDDSDNDKMDAEDGDNEDYTYVSGVDELNLLSKLYSENEMDSSQECSVSVVSLDSVDTEGHDSDNNSRNSDYIDKISIEDSSYSENEGNTDIQDDQPTLQKATERKEGVENETNKILCSTKPDQEIFEKVNLPSSEDEETSCAYTSIFETIIDGESTGKGSADGNEVYKNNNAIETSELNPINNFIENTRNEENSVEFITSVSDCNIGNGNNDGSKEQGCIIDPNSVGFVEQIQCT